ncbi:MAG: Lrp/AsnC family transcriptional regulator [Nitrososphaera sp.]|jgi:DNA-binding Lrp family transcriptional regulator
MPKRSRVGDTTYKDNAKKDKIVFDTLNINIAKEILNDADVRSADIAARYGMPLSTIQRRRTRLERSVLKKNYQVNIKDLGWRNAEILIAVEKGKSEEVAKMLLKQHDKNIASASLRIGHPNVNVMVSVFYRTSEELHSLIEAIRGTQNVTSVEWTELAKEVGTNRSIISEMLFKSYSSPAGRS